MAINRVMARIVYTKVSGLSTWSRDQMSVRYGQATAIKKGLKNEENPKNEVIEDPENSDNEIFVCDLPLSDSTYAEDAYNTLSAASVWTQALEGSYIEHHICHHDETPQQPCETIDKKVV